MKLPNTPLLLIILDGFGINDKEEGNAIKLANMANYESFLREYPYTKLDASGRAVGLPSGVMGNSEVGHMTIGAGRIPWQDITRIDKSIEDGSFFSHPLLLQVVERIKINRKKVHLWGLVSDGAVHSVDRHYFALLKFFSVHNIGKEKVVCHIVTDGRDTEPKIAKKYVKELQDYTLQLNCGTLFCVAGRYYAMDRDKRWDRTKLFYQAITQGVAPYYAQDAVRAIELAYQRGETDEFIKPTILFDKNETGKYIIEEGDTVICFNFRADRARQITRALTESDFKEFDRQVFRRIFYLSMTEYFSGQSFPCLFPPLTYTSTLGEVLSNNGIRQFRIAETEKYAHITYFLNSGREKPFREEERVLIPSQKVATYDLTPLMSAPQITKKLLEVIHSQSFPVYIVNYANPDMVGHTGNLEATIDALKYIDYVLAILVKSILEQEGTVIITADHGNCEQMIYYETKTPHTAHTTNQVPFVLISENNLKNVKLKINQGLSSIAPTILQILQIGQPPEFEAESLIIK
ncbi:MAG: 2,3-bisphosphoglycerate-independent phosphoglycerate mutase [Planctomycetota bacterium]